MWRRSRWLVVALLGEVFESGRVTVRDLVAFGAALEDQTGVARWSGATVEKVVRELAAFGVVRVTGERPPMVVPTVLGRAWLERVLLPLPSDPSGFRAAGEALGGGSRG